MHKKGLTLLEILVAMLILALVMTGMVNLFITGKKWILHARSRMTGGALGKSFLDPLQMQVRQDQWGNNCLSTGTEANCPDQTAGEAQGLDRDYTAHYTVTPSFPITNLNKVKVAISWTEE